MALAWVARLPGYVRAGPKIVIRARQHFRLRLGSGVQDRKKEKSKSKAAKAPTVSFDHEHSPRSLLSKVIEKGNEPTCQPTLSL
jgi:hypothetical protein